MLISRQWRRPSGTIRLIGVWVILALEAPALSAQPIMGSDVAAAVAATVKGIVSFTRWPQAAAVRHLCVVGAPQLAGPLLAGWVDATGVAVQASIRQADDPQLGAACDIVYLGALAEAPRQRLRSALAGHPVLSISESDPGCSGGSMFCLKPASRHIAFDINLDAVSRSGVRVHPSVLRLSLPSRAMP